MADPLPPHVWFLMWRGRFWAIRREGKIMMAKLAGLTVVFGLAAVLLAGFVHWAVGIAFGVLGIGWSQWWFSRIRRQHTDYSMTLDEYWKKKAASS
jgi:O-antigen/teichoic acid export membrane protein